MLEARIKLAFVLNQRLFLFVCFFVFDILACADIHTTHFSRGHDIFVKMIKKDAGGGW